MSAPFEGKSVLVAGASGGIGRAVCLELARRGARVAMMGRNRHALKATLENLDGAGHLALCGDLCDFPRLPELMDRLTECCGRVDALAYCAGVAGRSRLRDTTPELLSGLMTINCFAFVELLRQLVRRKKKTDPLRAVALSSLAALGHHRYLTAYAASKGALEAAAKTLAVELMPRNVRINLVRCAYVDTPMATAGDPYDDFAGQLKESGYQPLGLIPPAVVAGMVALLLGPEGAYCTGQILTINAGAAE